MPVCRTRPPWPSSLDQQFEHSVLPMQSLLLLDHLMIPGVPEGHTILSVMGSRQKHKAFSRQEGLQFTVCFPDEPFRLGHASTRSPSLLHREEGQLALFRSTCVSSKFQPVQGRANSPHLPFSKRLRRSGVLGEKYPAVRSGSTVHMMCFGVGAGSLCGNTQCGDAAFGEPVPAMQISLVLISPQSSVGLQEMASITGC